MFTNNKFGKLDAVADAIKSIAEADYKAKMEELKGQQHKIDKNKNNKIDADDFKILRGEKKTVKEDAVEESNNPFDVKNYKSQLKSKPGEKAGFDSKKISTGTVYSRKPVKDEPMKKEDVEQTVAEGSGPKEKQKTPYRDINSAEYRAAADKQKQQMAKDKLAEPGKKLLAKKGVAEEIDPNDTTTDTLKGREKTSGNPFLSKKVKMDVPDNVKEEAEQIDELKKATVKSYLAKKMASLPGKDPKKDQKDMMKAHHRVTGVKPTSEEVEQIDEKELTLSDLVARSKKHQSGSGAEAEMQHHRLVDGKPNVPKRVGSKDIHLHHIGTGNSTGEDAKYKVIAAGARSPLKAKVGSTISGKKVNDHMEMSDNGGTVHVHTARPKAHFMNEDVHEEVQHVEERTLTKGETAEKERIVKGMKKSLKGFKARYGERAKEVMYATATKAAKKD